MRTFVPFTSDEEIAFISSGLVNRTLPKTVWTHAAHFAAVLWLLKTEPRLRFRARCLALSGLTTKRLAERIRRPAAITRRLRRLRYGLLVGLWLVRRQQPLLYDLQRVDVLSAGRARLAAGVLDSSAAVLG